MPIDPHRLRAALLRAGGGYSPDRIVADSELNHRFFECCRQEGLTEPLNELNWALLNARKTGALAGLRCTRPTKVRPLPECAVAAEIAVRLIEQRQSTSLDGILADPEVAAEFDQLAATVSPGFSSLEYRWAALGLRKKRRLRPELTSRVVPASQVELGRLDSITPTDLPTEQGVYLFHAAIGTLYVGEASNLRTRLTRHLDHSDNKGLARFFWTHGTRDVSLELRILAPSTPARSRKALEAELIRSRHPRFNVALNR